MKIRKEIIIAEIKTIKSELMALSKKVGEGTVSAKAIKLELAGIKNSAIDIEKDVEALEVEKAFVRVNWGVWQPVIHEGKHMDFDSTKTMDVCREQFKGESFGIAPTSQMLMDNTVRDNL